MPERSLVEATMQLPCSVVILSASSEDKQGAMTACAMYVSQQPPLLVVSVSKEMATYQLIEKSKEFAVNVLADNQLDLAGKFGSVHGFEVDKFAEFGIDTMPASEIKAPLVSGCFSNTECRVKDALWDVAGNHAIYIGEVVAFRINKGLKPAVWLNNQYYRVGSECKT
jgi:flavin reductase (DIM6/NTAB) family NADH-FMN oxidoreductase RutF